MNSFDYAMGSSALSGDSVPAMLFVILTLFFLCYYAISFIFVIVAYVLEGISFQTLAKRRAVSKPWLAWVPVAKFWLLGAIASDYDRQNGKNKNWGRRVLTSFILFYAFFFIYVIAYIPGMIFAQSDSMIGLVFLLVALAFSLTALVFSIIYCVFTYICIYKIFKSTVGKTAWIFLLLAIFVPISLPICLFVFRNKGYEVMSEDNLIVEQVSFE